VTRRKVLTGGAALAGALFAGPPGAHSVTLSGALSDARPGAWLAPTRYIDRDDTAIRRLAARLAAGTGSDRARALAIFHHVSREIRFGFAAGFWDMPASAVLAAGVGYCNTKSTLFIALLRAAGIPARQRFMDIDVAVLAGLIDPGTGLVDHSTTEVWIDGNWIETDAYIVDPPLLAAARRRLIDTGARFGFAAHHRGTDDWDGGTPAYSQYNRLAGDTLGSREWGLFADVGDFYARADAPWNRLNLVMRRGFGVLAAGANRRAEVLRSS